VCDCAHYTSWKAPYIFHASPSRVADLWQRNRGIVVALGRAAPDMVTALKPFLAAALGGRDRDILDVIGYPATDAFVRTLGKLTACSLHPHALRQLLDIWAKPWARKLLLHIPNINDDVLSLLNDNPKERVNFNLAFRAAMTWEGHKDVAWGLSMLVGEWQLARRIANKGESAGDKDCWPYGNLRYADLHHAVHRLHLSRYADTPFPAPPVPGTETIRPITTLRSLFNEGKRQCNCAFSMQAVVVEGRGYFYHLTRHKCQCTVLLVNRDGYAACTELKAWQNRSPSIQAIEEVMCWLRNAFPFVDPQQLDNRNGADPDEEWDEEVGEPLLP
jgi:hypothetical protein